MTTQVAQVRVKPIPEGFQTVTVYLLVEDTRALIDFAKNAFNAAEIFCLNDENGIPGHAELKIGTSIVMVGRARNQWKPLPCLVHLYVENADAVYEQALAAGGKPVQKVEDQFYGDRSGGVLDPCGNYWWIATHIEDVPVDELKRRGEEVRKQQS